MAASSESNEILCMLLVNLKNATATFGEDSSACEGIRSTIKDHLNAMNLAGVKTDLTTFRENQRILDQLRIQEINQAPSDAPNPFANLVLRPKPKG